ncbi:MAG TPA: alpha/beta fold hydrolase [Bordetella sp.]|nr:alpha/beta fold hydrolase [Bordetella sp.]
MQVLVDGHAVAYSDDGQGTPLVLLHAFAADRTLWKPQVQALSRRWRVIAVDLRGFGASGRTNGAAVDIDRYADDVAALLVDAKIGSAVVGGISLGGYVSLAIAQRHPHLLRGLLLANTRAGADTDAARAARHDLAESLRQQGSAAVAAFYGDKLYGPTMSESARQTIRAMLLRQHPQGMISALLGMAQRPDRSNFLGEINVPTLIVSGTADALIPSSESRFMHDRIHGSVFVDIPDAGHLSNMDKPDAFNRAVEQFMEKIA